MSEKEDFCTELNELFKKHNASLRVDIIGDDQGLLYDFVVDINGRDNIIIDNRFLDSDDLDKVIDNDQPAKIGL